MLGPIGEMEYDWVYPEQHKNFVGWRVYRAMLPGEACASLPKKYILCNCENLGWPGVIRCEVHGCKSRNGCSDYPDPFRGHTND
jgi:hypothetical protein